MNTYIVAAILATVGTLYSQWDALQVRVLLPLTIGRVPVGGAADWLVAAVTQWVLLFLFVLLVAWVARKVGRVGTPKAR